MVVLGKKYLVLMLILSCVLLLMVGCDPDPVEPDPTSYTLTMLLVVGEGTVYPDVGTHKYDKDDIVNITATPAEGYMFEEWVGEVANAGSASTTVLMNKDQTVQAVFKEFDDHAIEFEDENLEQAVREAIEKLEGDLYLSDIIGLEELDARGREIVSLEGIQHLQNIKRIDLGRDGENDTNNYIEDISPLENLTSIEWLDFWWNQVLDISPLENLTRLERLNFGWNQVLDINSLENLTSLERLYLQDNQVSDISPLENLTRLKRLNIAQNQVSNISPLKNLTSLERLYFWGNQVSDISPLKNLIHLERLNLFYNKVSDISSLENLTSLERLYLQDNQVSDISPLVANTGFGLGDEIDIRRNYLDLTPTSPNMQDINTLIGRGVGVEYKPQRDP